MQIETSDCLWQGVCLRADLNMSHFSILWSKVRGQNISNTVLFYCLISEDEEEDFSKGAEDFVEAAKKRRAERQSDKGNSISLNT